MFKKILIENQKNNRIFISFPTLFDISNEVVINKILSIISCFTNRCYVKISSKYFSIKNELKQIYQNDVILLEKDKNFLIFFKSPLELLKHVLKIVDFDNSSIEIFVFNDELDLLTFTSRREDNSMFYMFIEDNDGPSLSFNKSYYNIDNILIEIKKAIK